MCLRKRKRFNKININTRIFLLTFKKNKKIILKKDFKILKFFIYYNKYIREIN